MQYNGGHHVAGAHGGLETGVPVRQGDVGELVEHEPHRNGQTAAVYLIRLEVKLLERLGIEHTHKKIQAHVVAVRDNAENGLFPFPQLPQLHLVPCGDPLYLRQGKWRETHSGADQDTHGRLAGGLLEHFVLPDSDMVRVLLLQRLEQKIKGGNMVAVPLLGRSILQHGQHHLHGLFLRRSLVEQIQHEGGIQGNLAFFPKRVIGMCVFRGGVANEICDQLQHVVVVADVVERVVAVGAIRVYQGKNLDGVALPEQQGDGVAGQLPLRIGGNIGGVGLVEIGLDHIAGLAGAGAAKNHHHFTLADA